MRKCRQRILFVVPYNPLLGSKGAQGPKNVSQPLIGMLAHAADLALVVVSADPSLYEAELRAAFPGVASVAVLRPVQGWQHRLARLRFLACGLPAALADAVSPALVALLRDEASHYDIVHFEYFTLAPYLGLLGGRAPVALHCHDAYSLFQLRCATYSGHVKEKLKAIGRFLLFRNLERRLFARANVALTVSPLDQLYLARTGLSNVRYLPPAFQPVSLAIDPHRAARLPEILCVVPASCQQFQLKAVRAFFADVVPELVLRHGSKLRVTLFGKTASRLKAELCSNAEVEAVDFADDYFAFLTSRNWIYFYPQRAGAGLHTKVRDAMAAGLPVVGFRDLLDAFCGSSWTHYVAASDAAEVAEALSRLLSSATLRNELTEGGHALLASHFGPANVLGNLAEAYAQIGCARLASDMEEKHGIV